MTTRQKLKEEFLTCIICHEVFTDPVTLHCGHTLCAQCVTTYTKTQRHAIAEKSLPCAHCRGLTKVPNPSRPVDEWAGQLKTGFLVKGLIDALVQDEKDEDVCGPCKEDGETTAAVFWCSACEHGLCSGCEKYHRKMPVLKDHSVVKLSEKDKTSAGKFRKRSTCSKHLDTVVDMFCEDCDAAVCHRCCIIDHRKCESVITLEECLPKLKSALEAHKRELDDVVKEASQELSLGKALMKDVEDKTEAAITVIDVSGNKIVAEVHRQQKQLKVRVRKAKENVLKNLQEDIASREIKLEEVKQRRHLITTAMEPDVLMNNFAIYDICKPSAGSHFKVTSQTSTWKNLIHMKVEDKSDEIVSHIRDTSIAFFSQFAENLRSTGFVSKPAFVQKIDTSLDDIWDILVMTIRGIKTVVVTSRNGKSVTSFYQKRARSCTSHQPLSGRAHNLTKMCTDWVAVVVESNRIDIFLVMPDLKYDTSIRTSKRYLGITSLDSSTFAASTGYGYDGSVDIIDMSGSVLRSFGSGYVSAHLTSVDDTIIITDFVKNRVTGISDRGVIKFEYSKYENESLQSPRGVCTSITGDIFVAVEESDRVIQLTDKGMFVKDVLKSSDGCRTPRALYVDDAKLMYVSVDHRTIHVYDVS